MKTSYLQFKDKQVLFIFQNLLSCFRYLTKLIHKANPMFQHLKYTQCEVL